MPNPCIITMLRSPARLEPHTCNEAANEIERLCRERDEARRMYCTASSEHCEEHEEREIARDNGWDCFSKEDEIVDTRETIERLDKECSALAANQCHAGYAGEYGHHCCKEIDRLTKEKDDAIQSIKSLEERIGNASILIADWDGYYDADNQTGNAIELAKLIEEAFVILQGKSWR